MSEEKDSALIKNDMLLPGSHIKLDHFLYPKEYDISELLDKSVEEVRKLYNESVRKEESMYEVLQAGLRAWKQDAAQTQKLQLALNYLEIAPVEHTGNQWSEDKNGVWTISNLVYKMTYKLSENPKWNLWSAKPLNDRWLVEWKVITNSPKVGNCGYVAGQKRKFEDRATAESYLNGRIRAYAKLFTELSPPVPENYKVFFMESGHILPGYRIEGQEQHQNKTSVLNQLNEAKSQQKAAPATPSKKKTEPEL